MNKNIRATPVERCFICNTKGTTIYKNLEDRIFGDTTGWSLSKCNNNDCGLIWLNPMPLREDIGIAYEDYYTHSDFKKSGKFTLFLEKSYQSYKYGYHQATGPINKLAGMLVTLLPRLRNKFDFNLLYLNKVKGGKVLDFGCGNGWILDNLKKLDWECHGLDFDQKAVDFCQSKGLNVQLGTIEEQNYPDNYFDAIVVNHVIEHIYDIDLFLSVCYSKLKENGQLVIATPNTENWQHTWLYKDNWMPLDPPRHLNIFNNSNLENLISRNSFTILKNFTSIRTDAWVSIVSRNIRKHSKFLIGKDQKSFIDLIVGLFHEQLSILIQLFDKRKSGEIVIIATKKE